MNVCLSDVYFVRAPHELQRISLQLEFAVAHSWSVPKAAEIQPFLFSICSESTAWPSFFLRARDDPFLLQDCSVNPEEWEFGNSVESITVKTGNMCKVTHTHTFPMNAHPPHTPHLTPTLIHVYVGIFYEIYMCMKGCMNVCIV